MAIDLNVLAQTALNQGLEAARGHAEDLKIYLKARATIMATGVRQIADDRVANLIDDEDVRFAFEEIRKAERGVLLVAEVTAKAAAQDALNAMFAVGAMAINGAVGIPIL